MSVRSIMLSGGLAVAIAHGQSDLQGNWMNKNATPLERPKQLEGRELLTDAEVAELKARAVRIFGAGNSDAANGDAVFLASLANVDRYKSETATGPTMFLDREFDNHTSLIVDPPDGKLPPYTPAGQQRRAAGAKASNMHTPPTRPDDMTTFQRCITFGVPMPRPGPFTSYYQIVQSPGYVVIVMEAIHDARIIPLDGRPHLPQNIRTWNGDSVGRWEGRTPSGRYHELFAERQLHGIGRGPASGGTIHADCAGRDPLRNDGR